ncbi:hypothetical protein HK405_015317, partial [Cladochytrium tenue]
MELYVAGVPRHARTEQVRRALIGALRANAASFPAVGHGWVAMDVHKPRGRDFCFVTVARREVAKALCDLGNRNLLKAPLAGGGGGAPKNKAARGSVSRRSDCMFARPSRRSVPDAQLLQSLIEEEDEMLEAAGGQPADDLNDEILMLDKLTLVPSAFAIGVWSGLPPTGQQAQQQQRQLQLTTARGVGEGSTMYFVPQRTWSNAFDSELAHEDGVFWYQIPEEHELYAVFRARHVACIFTDEDPLRPGADINLYVQFHHPPIYARAKYSDNVPDDWEWDRVTCENLSGPLALTLARSLVYRLTFTRADMEDVRTFLRKTRIRNPVPRRISVLTDALRGYYAVDVMEQLQNWLRGLPLSVGLQCEALLSSQIMFPGQMLGLSESIDDAISRFGHSMVEKALYLLRWAVNWEPTQQSHLPDWVAEFQSLLHSPTYAPLLQAPLAEEYDQNQFCMVYHINITPTCTYVSGPVRDNSNRVIREFSELAGRFVRVNFVEEDGGPVFEE